MAIEKPWDATPEERETIRKEFEAAIARDMAMAKGEKVELPKPWSWHASYWLMLGLAATAFGSLPVVCVLVILSLLKYLRS